jgi:hypothetical protein
MRTEIMVNVKAADCRRLTAIVANRNSPQKHVWRARIVLLTADGLGTAEIMRQTGARANEEADELLMPMAWHTAADHLAVQDIERGEQGGGAMTLGVVGHVAQPLAAG